MNIDAVGRAPQPLPLSFPCVHIVLMDHHTVGKIDGIDYRFLSCELVNEIEIDSHVDRLIKELDVARKKAKRSLQKQKSRRRSH